MNTLTCSPRLLTALTAPRSRDERGDVPGWVLVTVMTAGLVGASVGIAPDQLGSMLHRRARSACTAEPCLVRSRPTAARGGGRRLRARAGRAGPALPRDPPGRAGAARAQHLGGGGVRGGPVRRHPRPGPADGAARTRDQISGALAGRFARGVDARETTSTGRPAVEVTVHVACPRWARRPGGVARRLRSRGGGAAVSGARPRRECAGRARLARDPAGVPMLWIVMSVFEVQRGAFAVSAAARAAARAYALAPDDASGLVRAREAARRGARRPGRARRHARRPHLLYAVPRRLPPGHVGDHRLGALPRRAAADADRLGGNRPSFALDATQTVPIGQFREVADAR